MLAVVTALKVPKPGTLGNSTFYVLCRLPLLTGSRFALRTHAEARHCFGGENEICPLLPMDMQSAVTRYVPVSTGCIIGLRVICASYRDKVGTMVSP
jgi:hypothetical protein